MSAELDNSASLLSSTVRQYRSAALWPHLSALDDGCLMRAEHLVEIDKTPAGAGVLNETPTGVSRVR